MISLRKLSKAFSCICLNVNIRFKKNKSVEIEDGYEFQIRDENKIEKSK